MMAAEGTNAKFRPDEKCHRRGNFPALAVGDSYGNGHTRPKRLAHTTHAAMLARLVGSQAFNRLATFASGECIAIFIEVRAFLMV